MCLCVCIGKNFLSSSKYNYYCLQSIDLYTLLSFIQLQIEDFNLIYTYNICNKREIIAFNKKVVLFQVGF